MIFGGQRVDSRDVRVDALGVGLQHRARLRRDDGERTHRRAPNPDRPQFDVAGERCRTKQLGKRAARGAPIDVHLEQPILRVDVPLHEVEVVIVAGLDMGDTVDVAVDLGRRLQAGKRRRGGLGGPCPAACTDIRPQVQTVKIVRSMNSPRMAANWSSGPPIAAVGRASSSVYVQSNYRTPDIG